MQQESQSSLQYPLPIKIVTDSLTIQNALHLTYTYPSVIYKDSNFLKMTIKLTPQYNMPSLPLQVQIRGYSHLQQLNLPSSINDVQMTQSLLLDAPRPKDNLTGFNPSVVVKKNQKLDVEPQLPGQYFLQGCLVLYQFDDIKQSRLYNLTAGKQYTYPVQFVLPPNLPVTLEHKLLKSVHITIKYSINIKILYRSDENITKALNTTLPLTLLETPKIYPYQELILNQKIRCYHNRGKQQDKHLNNICNKISKMLCPNTIYNKLFPTQYSKIYNRYDVFFIELLVVVNKDHHLFINVRSYKEPDVQELSVLREKKKNKSQGHSILKEESTIGQMPPQISLNTIKNSQRKNQYVSAQKVQVQLWAEIKDMQKEQVFTKDIYLTRQTYDMLQGQAIVQLKDYIDYPRCSQNQLFDLHYFFKVKTFFEDEDGQDSNFQLFTVDQTLKQLDL